MKALYYSDCISSLWGTTGKKNSEQQQAGIELLDVPQHQTNCAQQVKKRWHVVIKVIRKDWRIGIIHHIYTYNLTKGKDKYIQADLVCCVNNTYADILEGRD